MTVTLKSNLEPIEEKDLDLKSKLKNNSIDFSEKKEKPVFQVEQKISKEVISVEKDDAYGNILSKIKTKQDYGEFEDVSNDAKLASSEIDAQAQVQHLVDIAMQRGVVHAVKVARHMENNFVLDTFHDRLLADELHDALMQKGLIKEL